MRDGQRLQEHQTRYVSECVQEQKENTACDRAVESLSLHASPDLDRLLIKRTRLQGIAAKLTWDFLHLTSWKHATCDSDGKSVFFCYLAFVPPLSCIFPLMCHHSPRNPSCIKRLKDLSASWAASFSSVSLLLTFLLQPALPLTFSPSYIFFKPLSPFVSPQEQNLQTHLVSKIECVCVYVSLYMRVCVCVCVWVGGCVWPWQALLGHESFTLTSQHKSPLWQTHMHARTHTHTWQDKRLLAVCFALVIRYMLTLLERLVKRQIENEPAGKVKNLKRRSETEWKMKHKNAEEREREREQNILCAEGKRRRRRVKSGGGGGGGGGELDRRERCELISLARLHRGHCADEGGCTEEGGVVTPQNDSEERGSKSLKKKKKTPKTQTLAFAGGLRQSLVNILWKKRTNSEVNKGWTLNANLWPLKLSNQCDCPRSWCIVPKNCRKCHAETPSGIFCPVLQKLFFIY